MSAGGMRRAAEVFWFHASSTTYMQITKKVVHLYRVRIHQMTHTEMMEILMTRVVLELQ